MEFQDRKNDKNYWMMTTLLLVGLILGFGISQIPFLKNGNGVTASIIKEVSPASPPPSPVQALQPAPPVGQVPKEISLRDVTEKDHIRGAKDATITLVEFSDTECPFCKKIHPTLQKLVENYPNDVRWVYRHLPLDSLHSKARKEAEATECANELGGNEKFWAYLDRLFEITPSNDQLDPVELPKIAKYVGLDAEKFEACLASGKYASHIADDLADGNAAGGSGTPYTILIAPDGKKYPITGAQLYETFSQAVERVLISS